MAYTEKSKQYRYQYEKEKLKRVPLDMRIDEYAKVKFIAGYLGEPVNYFIKKAIELRVSAEYAKIRDAMEAAIASGKTEEEFLNEEVLKKYNENMKTKKEKDRSDNIGSTLKKGFSVILSDLQQYIDG